MGVPKFFRWISERYPAISQLIKDSRIPEFDNFYLDMNGIIHNCTHKDSDTATTRMTEEEMFRAIFNYIEHLFATIKPKKLFFMAIDGVAPRAKMNQQRARRFRTALDAEKAREKAIKDGVKMPTQDPFDSNCITPGTEFMAKLSELLRYFVNRKVSEDTDWQGVEIVLSGHEVPGEGEHKIMEYIRQAKSQPDYDSNIRHCLYGLDADLIMLGLLSHDPHFCLLREEVTFGHSAVRKTKELQHQNFYLLHLCLVREYLELEFQSLKEPGVLPFEFDLERVIDDFILMAFFIGNDFLPHLPHVHINEGALSLMFELYQKILPKAGGYLNERGSINLPRVALLLEELKCVEKNAFEVQNPEISYLSAPKVPAAATPAVKSKKGGGMIITRSQRDLYLKVKEYIIRCLSTLDSSVPLALHSLVPDDRVFVQEMATKMNLKWSTPEDAYGDRYLELSLPIDLAEITSADEANEMLPSLVFKKYDSATVVKEAAPEKQQVDPQVQYDASFKAWKNSYYHSKLGWGLENAIEMKKLARNYVQGLQWVLFYYYRGIASWPWFYQYHYAPMISDVHLGFDADLSFDLGVPFLPFEQLMGVLPDRSKSIVPTAYWDLMTSPESPIIDFYPRDFELDMNGKKAEWEAVVKIPFIQEDRLLQAMATRQHLLSADERSRNQFGFATVFVFDPKSDFLYMSPLPTAFPDVIHCRCAENVFEPPSTEGLEIYHGLMPGAQLGKEAMAGFPSLHTLPFTGALGFHEVTVFQNASMNKSMVISLIDTEKRSLASQACQKLGKSVYVRYPYLTEAKVVKVTDEAFDYLPGPTPGGPPIMTPHSHERTTYFHRTSERLEEHYSKRMGMVIGPVEAIVQVELLKGLKKTSDGALVKEFAPSSLAECEFPAQLIVDSVFNEDSRFTERAPVPIEEEFPLGSIAVFLGQFAYGQPAQVFSYAEEGRVHVNVFHAKVPTDYYQFGHNLCAMAEKTAGYMRLLEVSRKLNIRADVLNAIVSTVFVRQANGKVQKTNIGLNLKFDFHKQKILHYSRHQRDGWEFSAEAVNLICSYIQAFPDLIRRLQQLGYRYGARVFASVVHSPNDLFSGDAAAQINEVRSWVRKESADRKFMRVPLDAAQLDSIQVGLIESRAAQFPVVQPNPVTLRNVPRHALLKSVDAEQRLGEQNFELGDRVEYVLNSGNVPIGRIGTVVGVTRQVHSVLLDVVFDMEMESGTTLDGRCKALHGQTLASTAVLNLTNPQLLASTKASSQRGGSEVPKGSKVGSGGGGGVHVGGNGRGEKHRFDSGSTFQARNGQTFRAAAAPAPLTGSYSSAATRQDGKSRGGRTGGGGGRGGRSGGRGSDGNNRGSDGNNRGNGNGNGPQRHNPRIPTGPSATRSHETNSSDPNNLADNFQNKLSLDNNSRGANASAGGRPRPPPSAPSSQGNSILPRLLGLFSSGSGAGGAGGAVAGDGDPPMQQSYNAVPPPPSLNVRRGRGGGRGGRGGRGTWSRNQNGTI